jgi:hypothetical protein
MASELNAELVVMVVRYYEHVVMREMLRVFGLTRRHAERLLVSQSGQAVCSILRGVVNYFGREEFAIFEDTPVPEVAWDVGRLWSKSVPRHLRDLREALERSVGILQSGVPKEKVLEGLAGRCEMRTRSRPNLYRERMKKELFHVLETEFAGDRLTQTSVDRLIADTVCRSRRDSRWEPEGAVPIGFARSAKKGYALFRCLRTSREFAMKEWDTSSSGGSQAGETGSEKPERLRIREVSAGGIVYASPAEGEFQGSVWLL